MRKKGAEEPREGKIAAQREREGKSGGGKGAKRGVVARPFSADVEGGGGSVKSPERLFQNCWNRMRLK